MSLSSSSRGLRLLGRKADAWVTPTSTVPIHVGTASDDTALNGAVAVK